MRADRMPVTRTTGPVLQRSCGCGGACGGCAKRSSHSSLRLGDSRFVQNFARMPLHAPSQDGGADETGAQELQQPSPGPTPAPTPSPSPAPTPTPAPTPAPTPTPAPAKPCPASVSVGQTSGFNHASLPAAQKDNFRTYLGTVSLMSVGPGPDHSGHSMCETLSVVSNNCPQSLTARTNPCSGTACLPINTGRSMGDSPTGTMVTDGPTSFIDLHRSRSSTVSFLEGTGVSNCSVVCRQTYACDTHGGAATTGAFTITRNFVAGTHTKADGTSVHITTGTVTKT